MLHIAIIDDEESCRNNLKIILADSKDYIVKAEADSVKSAIRILEQEYFDVLLMDIELGDGIAFDILDNFSALESAVIFITAHNDYALKAFQYSALDYLLKPVVEENLFDILKRIQDNFDLATFGKQYRVFFENFHAREKPIQRIVLKTADIIYVVEIADIIRCEADNNYTCFYLKDNSTILVSKSLKEYEKLLSSHQFIRVHHSHLVNINHIKRFHKQHGLSLLMSDNSMVDVSIRKKDQLLVALEQL